MLVLFIALLMYGVDSAQCFGAAAEGGSKPGWPDVNCHPTEFRFVYGSGFFDSTDSCGFNDLCHRRGSVFSFGKPESAINPRLAARAAAFAGHWLDNLSAGGSQLARVQSSQRTGEGSGQQQYVGPS